jgi:hypothetical protein
MNAKKIAAALLVLSAWLAPASQAIAAPAPAWKLTAAALPTNFVAGLASTSTNGPMYVPIATNIGGAATTSGEIKLEVTLPPGVTFESAGGIGNDPTASNPTCTESEPQVVTCTTPDPLHPGRWLGAKIVVDVSALASGTLESVTSISGGGAASATDTVKTPVSSTPAPFGFLPGAAGFTAPLTNEDGSPAVQAGSHPFGFTSHVAFPVEKVALGDGELLSSTEHPRSVEVNLPRGLMVNPAAVPVRCTEAELISGKCPDAAQVGTVTAMTQVVSPQPVTSPLFNMVPPPGTPASLAFNALKIGAFVHLMGGVRSDGDYGLFATSDDILARAGNPVLNVQAQLWGDPSSPSHDSAREATVEPRDAALLAMPSECSGERLPFEAFVDSWENPSLFHEALYESADLGGSPVSVEGCNALDFEPSIEAEPTTNLSDSPSGLRFNLHQPQNFDLSGLSTAALRDAIVSLPQGMSANPSQAGGLQACSTEQIGLATAIEEFPINFDKAPDSCPDAAKLGMVEVSSPLLAEVDASGTEVQYDPEGNAIPRPLQGSVYLAEPFDNPFGSLLAIYISVNDPESGIVSKLAGEVEADPQTGQLTSIFEENPQLPLEDVELELFDGPRAPLRTPLACTAGPSTLHTSAAELIPWSSPEGATAFPTDGFALTSAPGGGPCAAAPQGAPHAPGFKAGTTSPQAGAYAPFVLKLSREDGSQEINGFEATLAPGLTGKLAGIATCSEAQIAAARARGVPEQGALEQSSPSCPASSQLGTVTVAAGAGITPFHVQGRIYLAGPYKGAPLSLVVVTPAVAGPFDLGAVVVRAAAYLDPRTAQVRAVSDPLPTILEGIPLDLRSATVEMNRDQFTLNPTSCDPMAIGATATSVFGQLASLSDRFQVGGCQQLPFGPKLRLRLLGGTKRGAHPRLRAILTAKAGEANIARTSVALPRSAFLDQAHIRTVCTRVQFAADQCPQGAIYGSVRATTPLLDEVLEGPVYLRSSDNELPDAVAVLKGPPSRPIQIEVAARIDSIRGGIRANFETVPDAPVKEVVVTMQGGRKGLLINSRNLCKSTSRATVKMDGQNGKVHDFRPVVKNQCGKKRRKAKRARHQRR